MSTNGKELEKFLKKVLDKLSTEWYNVNPPRNGVYLVN